MKPTTRGCTASAATPPAKRARGSSRPVRAKRTPAKLRSPQPSATPTSDPPPARSTPDPQTSNLANQDGKTSTARPSPATIPTLNRQPPACLRSDRALQLTHASEDGTGFSDINLQGTMLPFDETQQTTQDFTSVPATSRSLGHRQLQSADWCILGNDAESDPATQVTTDSAEDQEFTPLSHGASIEAKERYGWRQTPDDFRNDVQNACVVLGLWKSKASMAYNNEDVTILCMNSCQQASMQGGGRAAPYYERFGHPLPNMARVVINGSLPHDIGTGFAEVKEWTFRPGTHPVILVLFGKHFTEQRWTPTVLLTFLVEEGHLVHLKLGEAIISSGMQRVVWFPSDVDEGCGTKFKQVGRDDCINDTRRLKTVHGQNGTQGTQSKYPHLHASMLAYANINCITMLQHFTSDEVVCVAIDSICVYRTALPKLNNVEDFVVPHFCNCGRKKCVKCLYLPEVPPGHWVDNNLCIPANEATLIKGTAVPHSNPLTRQQPSNLNRVDGSGNSMEVKTRGHRVFNYSYPSTRLGSAYEEIPENLQPTEQQLRKAIGRKFKNHKRKDKKKGRKGFNLTFEYIMQIRSRQHNNCAVCNVQLLWVYQPGHPYQFSIDRLDNSRGHVKGNVRLTCLSCNLKRSSSSLKDLTDIF